MDTDASSNHRRQTERASHEAHFPHQVNRRLRRHGGRTDRRRRDRRDRDGRDRKRRLPGPPAPRPAPPQPADASCQGIGFTVLHNDRSGGLVLPAGPYKVSSPDFSCKTASSYFTTFLNKYQGPIPGWTGKHMGYGYAAYTNDTTKQYLT